MFTWKEDNQTLILLNSFHEWGNRTWGHHLLIHLKITLFVPTSFYDGHEIFRPNKASSRSYQNLVLWTSACILFKERFSLSQVYWRWQLLLSTFSSYVYSPEHWGRDSIHQSCIPGMKRISCIRDYRVLLTVPFI